MLIDRNEKPTFESPQYIDNFLSDQEYTMIRNITMNEVEREFPYFPQRSVAYPGEEEKTGHWNWYATHSLYKHDRPTSPMCDPFYNIFARKFYEMGIMTSLMRIKANFYPWTETVREHPFHTDYDIPNHAALFSVNTCDGYTEFEDGTKVDSVANRLMFFDPQVKHRSTTTTTEYGRFNINFNFL